MSYDRMNPTITELVDRLDTYSKIDYGAEAYALSVAEATLIVAAIKQLSLLADIDSEFTYSIK